MLRNGTYMLLGILLITAVGCYVADPRTSNQGGGTIFSAGLKLLNGQIGSLNPDEWQILADNLPTIAAQYGLDLSVLGQLPPLSDEQAAAIVQFLADYNVQTLDDLQRLAQSIDTGQVEPPQSLQDLGTSLFL